MQSQAITRRLARGSAPPRAATVMTNEAAFSPSTAIRATVTRRGRPARESDP
jgi:hypothetical protein